MVQGATQLMQVDEAILVVAAATLVVAILTLAATVVVPVVLRRRDRVQLEITRIWLVGESVHIEIRNHGGTPTTIRQVIREPSTAWPSFDSFAPLRGRGSITYVMSIVLLATYELAKGSIFVEDIHGHRSPSVPIPKEVIEASDEWRRANPGSFRR
jgi:hypothetical protein